MSNHTHRECKLLTFYFEIRRNIWYSIGSVISVCLKVRRSFSYQKMFHNLESISNSVTTRLPDNWTIYCVVSYSLQIKERHRKAENLRMELPEMISVVSRCWSVSFWKSKCVQCLSAHLDSVSKHNRAENGEQKWESAEWLLDITEVLLQFKRITYSSMSECSRIVEWLVLSVFPDLRTSCSRAEPEGPGFLNPGIHEAQAIMRRKYPVEFLPRTFYLNVILCCQIVEPAICYQV